MSRTVAVVGGGIIGLCCAYYLRRDGHDVVVFDRDERERCTTSFGNQGMLVPSHFVPLAAPGVIEQGMRWMGDPKSPFYFRPRLSAALLQWGYRFWRASSRAQVDRVAPVLLALNLASRREYQELHALLGGGFGLESRGLLMLCATDHGLAEEAVVAVQARTLGLEAHVLSHADLVRLEPDITIDAVGAVHYLADGHLDPAAFMATLEERLVANDVGFRWGEAVETITTSGDSVTGVRTAAGEFRADSVVIAAGSWSPVLARSVGARILIEPGKGYSLTVPNLAQRLRTPAILSEARAAVTPMGDRLRIGGTMELSGFGPSDRTTRVSGIVDSAMRYLPDLDRAALTAAPAWQGLRPCSPDGLPYLGADEVYSNLVFATGHAMLGVSLAPITGRLVADAVAGRPAEHDITALRPRRHQFRRSSRVARGVGA